MQNSTSGQVALHLCTNKILSLKFGWHINDILEYILHKDRGLGIELHSDFYDDIVFKCDGISFPPTSLSNKISHTWRHNRLDESTCKCTSGKLMVMAQDFIGSPVFDFRVSLGRFWNADRLSIMPDYYTTAVICWNCFLLIPTLISFLAIVLFVALIFITLF